MTEYLYDCLTLAGMYGFGGLLLLHIIRVHLNPIILAIKSIVFCESVISAPVPLISLRQCCTRRYKAKVGGVWHPRGTHYFELLFCCSREGTSLHAYSSVNKFMPVMNYTPIKYSGHISMILVQQCHVNHLSFRFIDVMISVVLPSFTTRP